jgi:hypothetical protein
VRGTAAAMMVTCGTGFALALLAAIVFCSDRPFEGDTAISPASIAKTVTAMKART